MTTKQQYLDLIRRNSSYPTFRGFIDLVTLLSYAGAAVWALGALIGGLSLMTRSFITGMGALVAGLLFAAISFLWARLLKEFALMLADIGDSVVDANSRVRQEFAAGAD
jgi:hypothetical protein